MPHANPNVQRFGFTVRADQPLLIDKIKSERNINTYLKELVFADMYAHDSLVSKPSVPTPDPKRNYYKDLRVSLRLLPGEDDDIIEHLRNKLDKGSTKASANAYVCSLIYHDLGYHRLANLTYVLYTPPKYRKKRPEGWKKPKSVVHFDVKISPDHPLVLAKLESYGFEQDYIKALIEEYVTDRTIVLMRTLDLTIPDEPYTYYRRKKGCSIRVEYKMKTENGFVREEQAVNLMMRLENEGTLSSFVTFLIYHDIGRHDLARREAAKVNGYATDS